MAAHFQDCLDCCGFTGTRTTVDNGDRMGKELTDGFYLFRSICDSIREFDGF